MQRCWTLLFLIVITLLIQGCGGPKSSSSLLKPLPFNPFSSYVTPPPAISVQPASELVPGSYFKIVTDVGTNKDTHVVEIQYLSGNRFIASETFFPGGDLSQIPYFHRRTGSYSIEVSNKVTHRPTTDSCNKLAIFYTYMSGIKTQSINVTWNDNTVNFYSYGSWNLPSDIASAIVSAVEDTGCVKFNSTF